MAIGGAAENLGTPTNMEHSPPEKTLIAWMFTFNVVPIEKGGMMTYKNKDDQLAAKPSMSLRHTKDNISFRT